ncbi:DICT sensory domain-containing protein [Halocalculus aciditolerans]|uniref:DICT domain-containing protein n=1 Tax=Halocalculus aciditolerans TaxID=1383812 RepID=A0A830FDH6_9EURY|nr:DICT sensory domain-containing protein [Halocalculus aciditolerans]GGL64116.1 hypothetical protein GCM10009039_22440 [Halocalculus aciditolerans]
MSLARFLDRVPDAERSLVVVNRTGPDALAQMMQSTFEHQSVDIEERDVPDAEDDLVLLVEDDEVVATSPFEALQRTILFVNSDLYRTGTQGIETLDLPAVLTHLDDVRFSLRAYPQSHKEKLLLIAISRYIEQVAWRAAGGRIRASFQSLSRLEDEVGTRRVYQTLADSPVDTHVYGVPDWVPPESFDVTMHGGYSRDFTDSWFVVFRPDEEPDASASAAGQRDASVPSPDGAAVGPVALLALEDDPGLWDGFWTFDADLAADVERYIMREL